jgi:membrane fusion protein (multidrug efflux system)
LNNTAIKGLKSFGLITIALILASCTDQAPTSGRGSQWQAMAYPVLASTVELKDLSRSVTLSNPVEALRVVELAARTDGVVTEVFVEEGDVVRQDQVLARIDVREQRAELARAKARLLERQANFDRFEQLKERNYIDVASYESARAELAVAESDVELWQTRVDFGEVTATVEGTVVDRMIEPGEAISRQGVLFSIADLSSLVVRLGVSELDVGQLQVGQVVAVGIDAVDRTTTIDGEIRRIFPAADSVSRLITVEIELMKAGAGAIRPGYLARVDLLVESYPNVLAIPAISVAELDGQPYVMVIDEAMTLQRRMVELGITRGAWREVTQGLSAGERVVPANPSEMRAGDRVRIVEWAASSE